MRVTSQTSRASETFLQDAQAGHKVKHHSRRSSAARTSRIAPELAFDQSPGDLFVVRVAGNFVTTDGLGSLEFGAAVLGTKVIMVLGHSSCGAVNATVAAIQKENALPGHIADLVRAMKPGIEPAVRESGADLEQRAVIANVRHNVEVLKQANADLSRHGS